MVSALLVVVFWVAVLFAEFGLVLTPHHGDPTQARLMLDLGMMIKAEGQSSILSKCGMAFKYYNRR